MVSAIRSIALGGAISALLALAGPGALRENLHALGNPTDPAARGSALLVLAAAVAAWTVVAWMSAVRALRLGARLPGTAGSVATRVAAALTPKVLSSVVKVSMSAAAGLGSTGLLSSPANAAVGMPDPGQRHADPCPTTTNFPDLDRAPARCSTLPEPLTSQADPRDVLSPPDAPAGNATTYVVQPRDTLWSIAAEELRETGPQLPTPQAIAGRWPSWWNANRNVIGVDPGLLHPGQILHAPAAKD